MLHPPSRYGASNCHSLSPLRAISRLAGSRLMLPLRCWRSVLVTMSTALSGVRLTAPQQIADDEQILLSVCGFVKSNRSARWLFDPWQPVTREQATCMYDHV